MKRLLPQYEERKDSDQSGINMVDLMMWLVIAALLLAAALQGIGYYQQNAYLYQMKNDAASVGTNVAAASANIDGKIDLAAVTDGIDNTKFSSEVTHNIEGNDENGNKPYVRVSHPSVLNSDVVFLFDGCGEYTAGVNMIPKGANATLESCSGTTDASPGGGTGGGGDGPSIDGTNVMTTVWDTSLPNCSNIVLPLTRHVDVTVDWGDGSAPQDLNYFYDVENMWPYDLPDHDYAADKLGLTTIKITGSFEGWVGYNWDDWSTDCITKITSWGDGTATTDMNAAFYGVSNLTEIARVPRTVTNYELMFVYSDFNGDISNWDISHVTNLSSTFGGSSFNGDISNWDTSNVTNMAGIFSDSVFTGDVSRWNTSKVTDMYGLAASSNFNSDITNWDVSQVKNMQSMFEDNPTFNQNLSKWTPLKVERTVWMFKNATAFNGDIRSWKFPALITSQEMFNNATSFNQDISGWETGTIGNMTSMFKNATSFNQDLSNWDVSSIPFGAFASDFGTGSGMSPAQLPAFPQ